MQKLFQTARLNALYHWIELTGRDLNYAKEGNSLREHISSNLECKWQQRNWEIHKDDLEKTNNHISIICSFNNWSSHVYDVLTDVTFDLVPLYPFPLKDEMEDEKGGKFDFDMYIHEKLMRHYSRFFLVVSELILDFDEIAKKLGQPNTNFYSENNVIDYKEFRGFINNVFKHKTNNFHKCTHHVPILFDDGFPPKEKYNIKPNEYMIEIGCTHDYSQKDKEYVLRLPRLVDIIKFLGICYEKLDSLLDDNGLKEISKIYGDKY